APSVYAPADRRGARSGRHRSGTARGRDMPSSYTPRPSSTHLHPHGRSGSYHAMTRVHPTAFIHTLAYVTGDVTLGPRVSVWPFASIRGDTDVVTIGDDTNVQDGCVVHVDAGVPCHIGKRVGIGHRAIVHGATVADDVLIAMGAILLNGVVVGSGSIIGAGAV